MKRTAHSPAWILLTAVAIVVGGHFFAQAQLTQHEAQPVAENQIALVDVSRIFKEHKVFRAKLEQMKVEVDKAEKELVERRDKMKELAAEMEALRSDEPLRDKLERELAGLASQLKLDMNLQKLEFMKQEARIYAETYRDVEQAVQTHCRPQGIKLVMRYSNVEADSDVDRKAILAKVNRPWSMKTASTSPMRC